jgi:hypothetical protein
MTADVREMERIYAEDYVQSDESGRLSTGADLIRNLRSGNIRFLSMTSTGREVRLLGAFAVVHGSEEDEIERDGATRWPLADRCLTTCEALARPNRHYHRIVAGLATLTGH